MSCSKSCSEDRPTCTNNCGNNYVCILVLYILLAIIVGSFIY